MKENIKHGKVAFVGFGEINSPKDLIDAKCREAYGQLKSSCFEIVTTATVTDDPAGKDVQRAISELKNEEFDVLVICLAGWIPSHAVISITNEFRHSPMILWGLAGDDQNGHIVTAAAQAGTTALRKVFKDLGYKFKYVYNIIGKPAPIQKIRNFIGAATAMRKLNASRIGMMGFRDMQLYNTLYDGMSLKQKFGIDVDFFEMLEMVQEADKIPQHSIDQLLQKLKSDWVFSKAPDDNFIKKGISYYLALKSIIEEKRYDAISLKDVDGMKKILKFPPAMIFMLLSDESGICTIPENDVLGAVTQLIIKHLTGQCGAYLEFYEFFDQSVLMGVPDYVPAEVVEGKVTVTNAAFGDISGGILNISRMKTGEITIARLSNCADQYTMHIGVGQGKFRSWEEAGWDQPAPQLPSLEIFLNTPIELFTENISGQHYIIAFGDHTAALNDFCYLNNINVV
jgi:L-fucose isomerase-like protein